VVAHTGDVRSVAFSVDGSRILTGGADGIDSTAAVWDAQSLREIRRWVVEPGLPALLTFSSDGQRALAAWGLRASLWDVATGQLMYRFESQVEFVNYAVPLPNRQILVSVGVYDRVGHVWDLSTGRVSGQGPAVKKAMVDYSRDHTKFVSIEGCRVAVVRVLRTGEVVRRFPSQPGRPLSVAYAPNVDQVLIGGDGLAILWDVQTGREVRRFAGHTEPVIWVSFSEDGALVLTCSRHGVRLWEGATGRELCMLVHFKDGSWAVVDPEGRFDANSLEHHEGLHWLCSFA
jgi:WD40 repeat protein